MRSPPSSTSSPRAAPAPTDHEHGRQRKVAIKTAVDQDVLLSLNEQLLSVPEGFTIHPKLVPQLERRRTAMTEGGITWAHAEALAYASLLVEGVPVRLTGQDAERGTFSQRHLMLHDVNESEEWHVGIGRVHAPIQHLVQARATFEVHNSPLSEAACVGFEYGYSAEATDTLVLWEAQYGDFGNGAQIMIDQFITAGHAKWGQKSRLTLLLPHGYEGNGPEHSSARPERFLQMCAQDNIRVANCSTAAQYFHLLRKQALVEELRPLVIFTPKSLLRLKAASSDLEELAGRQFSYVLDDPTSRPRRDKVRRVVFCTGKIYHELDAHAARAGAEDLAIARLEMLAPFPHEAVRTVLERYPNLERIDWVQEEPRNMGAWDFVRINRSTTTSSPRASRSATSGGPRGRAPARAGRPLTRRSRRGSSTGIQQHDRKHERSMSKNVVVLGGGPAGDVVALRAAQLGNQVVMVEKDRLGGTCLNWGCIPTKALLATADLLRKVRRADEFGLVVGDVGIDFGRMMARKDEVVTRLRSGVEAACKKQKVEVVNGFGVLKDGAVYVDERRIDYDILVSARARPRRLARARHGPPGDAHLRRHPGADRGAEEPARHRRRRHRL